MNQMEALWTGWVLARLQYRHDSGLSPSSGDGVSSLAGVKELQVPGMGYRTKVYDLFCADIIQAGSFSG